MRKFYVYIIIPMLFSSSFMHGQVNIKQLVQNQIAQIKQKEVQPERQNTTLRADKKAVSNKGAFAENNAPAGNKTIAENHVPAESKMTAENTPLAENKADAENKVSAENKASIENNATIENKTNYSDQAAAEKKKSEEALALKQGTKSGAGEGLFIKIFILLDISLAAVLFVLWRRRKIRVIKAEKKKFKNNIIKLRREDKFASKTDAKLNTLRKRMQLDPVCNDPDDPILTKHAKRLSVSVGELHLAAKLKSFERVHE